MHRKEFSESWESRRIKRLFYGPTELRAGWRLLIFIAIALALLTVKDLIFAKAMHEVDKYTVFAIGDAVAFLVFLVASWIMAKLEGRRIADYGLPWQKMFGRQFWQGTVLGFGSITALLACLRIAGVFKFGAPAVHGAEIWKWAAFYCFLFLAVGFKEEFQYRGYAQFTLSTGIGWWPAALAWSLLFGFSHANKSGETIMGLFNATLFGLLSCVALRRTGTLWLMVGLHAAFDWGETYFYGVADSGQTLPGHLLESSFSGPAWLTGGSVGPEGSWICTLLLVTLGLILAAWFRENKYPNPETTSEPAVALPEQKKC